VDLPTADVRSALFALHLKKRSRDVTSFDLPTLATASEGFSGAEIEQAIVAGLYTAFAQNQQLTTDILLAEIRGTRPSASPAPRISKPSATGPKPAPSPPIKPISGSGRDLANCPRIFQL